ncbi:LysR family transcriptional regulator [Burkholderia sp. L27(2015)]|uniref:LysR family transcriptional regulator n=1 Tax=Burkholderia sp. L27(2015) TaxID=1641858 RepID=UPI00349E8858
MRYEPLVYNTTMLNDSLDGVTTFLAVAETCSFTTAARRLGVTPTAVSKAIRVMESKHGVTLFQRTTRRVALTEAGEAAFLRLRPAALEISETFAALGGFREKPMGSLRITAPHSASGLLAALVPAFRKAYPAVTLEISLDDAIVDIVASGYDAGIRLGDSVEKDMVAVRLTPEITWSVVGAPNYLAIAGRPTTPEELVHHQSIRYRFSSSRAVHRWGFKRGKRKFLVDVPGGLIVNERRLLVELCLQGLGLAFVADREVREYVADGRLEPFLQTFIPNEGGLYLYFPERSLTQLKLRVFVDLAKELTAS